MLETIHSEHHSSSLLISLPQSTLWTEDRWMCQLCWSYQDTCLSDRLRSRTVHRVCCSLLYLLNGNAWYNETLQVSHTQPPPRVYSDSAERGKTWIDGRTSKKVPAIFWTTHERRLYFQIVLMLSDLPPNWLCCKNARKCSKKMCISQMIDRSRTRVWIDF